MRVCIYIYICIILPLTWCSGRLSEKDTVFFGGACLLIHRYDQYIHIYIYIYMYVYIYIYIYM